MVLDLKVFALGNAFEFIDVCFGSEVVVLGTDLGVVVPDFEDFFVFLGQFLP